ncbi:TPA: MerR family transcriptional regulator [Bacillus cereus]|uniref:MerR family transcriptional regulator n=1 Tax=Bacillus TaxID=1386 RepID=UPI00277D0A36|nr:MULTISPECIES: MerR family transcriptional regulator [Bacillus]MDQ4484040.1 MerR family transcriptional regulator [Bacillus cereus]MDU3869215.1 MerR family transcriptional regulator [Bacillus paranthracis]WNV22495.1 MerR family transcriptional regulator [Bacillus sp. SI2]
MNLITTGDVKKVTGLTERTIRYYSELNLITPKRNNIGQIHLSRKDLLDLIKILNLKIVGKNLKFIGSLNLNELSIKDTSLQLDEMYNDLECVLISLNHLENSNDEDSILNALKLAHVVNDKYMMKRGYL